MGINVCRNKKLDPYLSPWKETDRTWGGEMWGRIRSKCTIYLRETVFVKPGLCIMTKNQHEREGENGREAGIGERH